ncbi:potassium-transporting ATPase subunit C, partial [bacterium]|nr:potassium-transporting ATPase subunit C [bacterium]
MMKRILHEIRVAVMGTLVLGILVCGIYPFLVWGTAQGVFPDKADGSLITQNGRVIGSRLIAQGFTGMQYFHPRPSAAGTGYDPASSGGSNLGPLSAKLMDSIGKRAAEYRRENNLPPGTAVPVVAVTASASGLDPHISPENAALQ